MKKLKLTITAISTIFIAACSSTRKSSATSTSSAPHTITTPASASPLILARPADGLQAPGNEELSAIQVQYKDVTLDKLNEGHLIYTQGACVKCHGAENIYKYGEVRWKEIIEDMAQKAMLSDAEKDAVYKYVLAIKATQAK